MVGAQVLHQALAGMNFSGPVAIHRLVSVAGLVCLRRPHRHHFGQSLLPWRKDLLGEHWELLGPERLAVSLPLQDLLRLNRFCFRRGVIASHSLSGSFDLIEPLRGKFKGRLQVKEASAGLAVRVVVVGVATLGHLV